MLIQLHHQVKDGHTEMMVQIEWTNHKDLRALVGEANMTHPLPKGAQWMVCNEKSEHFVWTTV